MDEFLDNKEREWWQMENAILSPKDELELMLTRELEIEAIPNFEDELDLLGGHRTWYSE